MVMSGSVFWPTVTQRPVIAAWHQPLNWTSQPAAASARDWVKSFDIDWISDWSVFSRGSTLFTDCMGNISMTYYTSFCISRLCPLLYIAACAAGINHFPASLLHEMKEFIMVTVGRCEAFTVIYLGEIDWFINTEWTALCSGGSAAYLATCRCVCWKNTSPVWRS